jgi:twitching motility protein PilT
VSSLMPEIQHTVAAQVADCLVGVVAQRLVYRPDLKIRLPECEILLPSHPVKHFIRQREFHKIISVMETGADHGMWTFPRYKTWMEKRSHWTLPDAPAESPDSETIEPTTANLPPLRPPATTSEAPLAKSTKSKMHNPPPSEGGPIEIEPVEGGWERLFKEFKELE